MKTPLVILLSLVLVWAQVAVSGSAPVASSQVVACKCCACGGTNCCISESAPTDSTPLTAFPVRTASANEILLASADVVAWTLPIAQAKASFFSDGGLLPLAGVPLFTRDCALLI